MATRITGVTFTQPSSDPGISPNGDFVMGGQITAAGGGGWNESGDMYFEWDQGTATWTTMASTGDLNVAAQTNPITGLQTTTEQTVTVYSDGTAGSFQIRVTLIEDDETTYNTTPIDVVIAAAADDCLADDITSGTPALGTPTATRIPNLTADGITTTPTLETPTLGQVHDLTADSITATPTLGTPTAAHIHDLAADGITASSPALGTPTAAHIHDLSADSITTTSTLGTPTAAHIHDLAADSITTTPVLGAPVLAEEGGDACVADNITAGTPVLGTPALGQEHGLSADSITTTPVLGAPTAAVIHNLLADNILTGLPVIDSAILGQEHALVADSVVAQNPVLGTPSGAGGSQNIYGQDKLIMVGSNMAIFHGTGSPVYLYLDSGLMIKTSDNLYMKI